MTAGPVVSALFDANPDTFVPIFYQFNDPYYRPWAWTRALFYVPSGTFYTPQIHVDGVDGGVGSGYFLTLLAQDVAARQAVPTDVTVDIAADLSGFSLQVEGTVCVEAGGTAKDLRVYVVQVLDHFPPQATYYRNCFRQVYTVDVHVDAGACVEVGRTFTVTSDDTAAPRNIGVVVWAQEPLATAPAEVHQVGMLYPVIFRSDFETGDFAGWSVVEP